jgi:hypothetical protein
MNPDKGLFTSIGMFVILLFGAGGLWIWHFLHHASSVVHH